MGLGRFGGGIGVCRWLAGQGARVTLTDQADAESLAESVEALDGVPMAYRLGGHDPADLEACDL
ncbi:MAG: UDP-N-acetylmuramoyl-L-alanine--D-glutamate ligase, partial [Phycisphaerae bacterium]